MRARKITLPAWTHEATRRLRLDGFAYWSGVVYASNGRVMITSGAAMLEGPHRGRVPVETRGLGELAEGKAVPAVGSEAAAVALTWLERLSAPCTLGSVLFDPARMVSMYNAVGEAGGARRVTVYPHQSTRGRIVVVDLVKAGWRYALCSLDPAHGEGEGEGVKLREAAPELYKLWRSRR